MGLHVVGRMGSVWRLVPFRVRREEKLETRNIGLFTPNRHLSFGFVFVCSPPPP